MNATEFQKMNADFARIISEENEKIRNRMDRPRSGRSVVVSKDFVYAIGSNGNYATCEVIGALDRAARIPDDRAIELCKEFHAENGYGPIEWQRMGVKEYLRRLLEQNERTLAYLNGEAKL